MSQQSLNFFVPGVPAAQAGMREVVNNGRRVLITTGSEGLRPWRKKVTEVAGYAINALHWQQVPRGSGVYLNLTFYFPMPKSRPAAVRALGWAWHTVKPDQDKCVRAIFDSLTAAGAYVDDQQVCELHVSSFEVNDPKLVGCAVWVDVVTGVLGPAPHPLIR